VTGEHYVRRERLLDLCDEVAHAPLTLVVAPAGTDLEGAHRRAAQLDDPFWAPVSLARVHLAAGDRQSAMASLDTAQPRCIRHDVVVALLRSRAATDTDEATKSATAAVEAASGVGMLQTVADEGAFELIEHAAWRAPAEWLDRLRRCAAEARACASSPGSWA
jgi:LuxR family maltose regulon positive regulatory protein